MAQSAPKYLTDLEFKMYVQLAVLGAYLKKIGFSDDAPAVKEGRDAFGLVWQDPRFLNYRNGYFRSKSTARLPSTQTLKDLNQSAFIKVSERLHTYDEALSPFKIWSLRWCRYALLEHFVEQSNVLGLAMMYKEADVQRRRNGENALLPGEELIPDDMVSPELLSGLRNHFDSYLALAIAAVDRPHQLLPYLYGKLFGITPRDFVDEYENTPLLKLVRDMEDEYIKLLHGRRRDVEERFRPLRVKVTGTAGGKTMGDHWNIDKKLDKKEQTRLKRKAVSDVKDKVRNRIYTEVINRGLGNRGSSLRMLKLAFGNGHLPHHLLCFGFMSLLSFPCSEMTNELHDMPFRQLAEKFQTWYQMDYQSLDEPKKALLAPLQRQMGRRIDSFPQYTVPGRFKGRERMPIGDTTLCDFIGSAPSKNWRAKLIRWNNAVKRDTAARMIQQGYF